MQLTDSLTFFCQFVDLWREERREGDEGDAEDDDEGGHHADHNGGATPTLRLLFGIGGSGVAARTERVNRESEDSEMTRFAVCRTLPVVTC